MGALTSRDRVLAAFNHQTPDRAPRDLGSKGSSLALGAYADFLKHLGLDWKVEVLDKRLGLAVIHEEILQKFKIDTRYVYMGAGSQWDPRPDPAEDTFFDEWGGLLKRPRGGFYYDHVQSALSGADLADLKNHPWPDPDDPARFKGLKEKAKAYYDQGFAVGSYMKGCAETVWIMRGMENAYKDMIARPDYYQALSEKISSLLARMVANFFSEVRPYVQFCCVTCDLGTQISTIVSPDFARKFILPHEKKIHDQIRKGGAKVAHHSCGAIFKLIPALIEIGVDILNPVQTAARGMDPAELKRAYGRDICFWGGVDAQKLLPEGRPEEVALEAEKLLNILNDQGGYLFGPSHDIQIFTPPANVVAMFEAADRVSGL